MTSLTDTQVITASGGLVELGYAERTSTYTIPSTSSSFADPLCGTVTIVTDGSPLLVEFQSPASSVATGGSIYVNLVVNGSVTGIIYQSIDGAGAQNVGIRASRRLTLSAGTHTINVSAWGSGSPSPTIQAGNGGVGSFHPMFLRVSKIVEATQWPAVTTGTIICTSSTRPASPFEGQVIYETDTDKQLVWNASAWKQVAGSSATFSDDLTVSGMLYQPNKPMFSARATAGTTATGTWTTYADVFVNVGNNFNTTNGLFTAPVAAKYFFTFSAFTEAGTSAQVYFLLNGVAYNRTYTANGTTTYVALNPGIVIFNLAAGDTVGVYINVGQTHWNQNNYFSGWMLG